MHNLVRMPRTLGEAVSARLDYWKVLFRSHGKVGRAVALIIYLVPIALGFLILIGIALHLMRREWLIPLYVLFFLALISVTPFTDMFTRYLIPLTPFLCLFLFEAVIWLKRNTETAPFRLLRIAGYFLVIQLLKVLDVNPAAHQLLRALRVAHLAQEVLLARRPHEVVVAVAVADVGQRVGAAQLLVAGIDVDHRVAGRAALVVEVVAVDVRVDAA